MRHFAVYKSASRSFEILVRMENRLDDKSCSTDACSYANVSRTSSEHCASNDGHSAIDSQCMSGDERPGQSVQCSLQDLTKCTHASSVHKNSAALAMSSTVPSAFHGLKAASAAS